MKPKLQLTPVLFVVPRASHDETTIALVHALVADRDLRDPHHFLQALIHAVTQWVATTREGARSWTESAHDFNVGDLHHYEDRPALRQQCVKTGIHQLHIECYIDLHGGVWHYDTVLVNEAAI